MSKVRRGKRKRRLTVRDAVVDEGRDDDEGSHAETPRRSEHGHVGHEVVVHSRDSGRAGGLDGLE